MHASYLKVYIQPRNARTHNGAFANTSSLRGRIETRWVARVLAGTFLSHMAGRSLPFQCFHSRVRFLFFSFPSHGKIRRALQLSLTPTLTLHTWISFHFFGGRQRSPLGLYHSLHNHLRHPDDRRPGKKREACRCRSCPSLLTGITGARQRQAVNVFPRGDSEV